MQVQLILSQQGRQYSPSIALYYISLYMNNKVGSIHQVHHQIQVLLHCPLHVEQHLQIHRSNQMLVDCGSCLSIGLNLQVTVYKRLGP